MVLVKDKRRNGAAFDNLGDGSLTFDQLAFYFHVAVASFSHHTSQALGELFEQAVYIFPAEFILAQFF